MLLANQRKIDKVIIHKFEENIKSSINFTSISQRLTFLEVASNSVSNFEIFETSYLLLWNMLHNLLKFQSSLTPIKIMKKYFQ